MTLRREIVTSAPIRLSFGSGRSGRCDDFCVKCEADKLIAAEGIAHE